MLGLGVAYLLPPSGVKGSLSSSMLSFSEGYSIIPLVKLTFSYSMSMQANAMALGLAIPLSC